jgi:hypothetical protein
MSEFDIDQSDYLIIIYVSVSEPCFDGEDTNHVRENNHGRN